MTFLLATIVYPLLLAALAIGAGLLVDRVAGGVLPGVLVAPIGLGVLVAVSDLLAWQDALGGLAPVALVLLAVIGFAVGFPRLRAAQLDPWPIAAAVGVYLMVCAPVLMAGRVTVPGYLLDTTVAFHLLGSDYLLEHARDFANLPSTTFRGTLEAYYGVSYPSGGQTLLGASGRIVGVDRLWLYAPLLSMLLAFCAPVLYYLGRAARLPRGLAAATALLGSAPALVYAYAQMGSLKELTALPFILLLGALLVILPRLLGGGLRAGVAPAVVAAGGIAAIGVSFIPWLALAAVAAVALALLTPERRPTLKLTLAFVGVLALVLVVLSLPTLSRFSQSISLAKSFSTGNQLAANDPGNLFRPLKVEQMLGVWLTGSHRGDPPGHWFQETYFLLGIAAIAAALGAAFLIRRRQWALAAWVASSLIVWVVLTRRGTTWTDAKLLVITSPVLVFLAGVGVESLRRAGRRVEGVAVGALLATGILVSNAFTYHDTNLVPTERYKELISIGERFSNGKPVLVPEFDEFVLYALPDMPPDGPGFATKNPRLGVLRAGLGTPYGSSFDLDQIPIGAVEAYDTILTRRRPDSSRPPANYRPVFEGRYYELWRKSPGLQVLGHLPAGVSPQVAASVSCRAVRRLADVARAQGGELRYVPRLRLVTIDPRKTTRPASWGDTPDGIGLGGPGTLRATARMPVGGRYRLWIKGDVGRRLYVSVNGKPVGSVAYESGNAGNYATPLDVQLQRGRNRIVIERRGGSLRPGDNTPTVLRQFVFQPADTRAEMRTASPSDWREACAGPVDWVEAVKPG